MLIAVGMMIYGCGAKQKNSADPPADEALESANHLARSAFDKGMYKQAAGIYEKVLGMAYVRNDAAVILDTRYNLAICLMELERYPEALKLPFRDDRSNARKWLTQAARLFDQVGNDSLSAESKSLLLGLDIESNP